MRREKRSRHSSRTGSPITATAILTLVEAGHLELDDPVSDYLPHLTDAPGAPITIQELLAHTSGMPSDGAAGPLIARWLDVGSCEVPLSSEADFRRHVQASCDRRVTDRDTFFYYNSGYIMLGQIIETVTGQAFADYIEDAILAPLDMERSTFDQATVEADHDRMTPYLKREAESTESNFPFDPLIYPAGGLVSSVRELSSFARQVVGRGADGASDAILSDESVAAMTTPVATFGTYVDGREIGYGYGLMIEEYLDDRVVSHGGSIAVSNAWFGYLEDAELGVSIACTTSPETHPWYVGMGIMAILQGHGPHVVHPHFRLTNALEAVTGDYTSYRDIMRATVERVGGGLTVTFESDTGGQELLLTPTTIAEDRLICTTMLASGLEREVRFEHGEEGVDLYFERGRLTSAG